MPTYIYQVTNTINGKVYFGKTTRVWQRWYDHVWDARHGSQSYFHRALRKHGTSVFEAKILATFNTDAEACAEEIRLIRQAPPGTCYNTAPGGTGGMTMTPEQVESQYTIKPNRYPVFRDLFDTGITASCMAIQMGVPLKAIQNCARRLGLSFKLRRAAAPNRVPKPRQRRSGVSKAKYTPEERSRIHAVVAAKNNVARGISGEMRAQVLGLYTGKHWTAKEISMKLGISRGSVRATINKMYAGLPIPTRAALKHAHGSAVRTGVRNPNSRVKRVLTP